MSSAMNVSIKISVQRDRNLLVVQPNGKVEEAERLTIGDEIGNCSLLDASTGDMVVLPPCMKFKFTELDVEPIIEPNAKRFYTLERVL